MMLRDNIKSIVGEENTVVWLTLKPAVFYHNNEPYGLIAITDDGYVASTTKSPELPFTKEMLQYLIQVNRWREITLITDDPDYFDKIRQLLEPHGFYCRVVHGALYSTRSKTWA